MQPLPANHGQVTGISAAKLPHLHPSSLRALCTCQNQRAAAQTCRVFLLVSPNLDSRCLFVLEFTLGYGVTTRPHPSVSVQLDGLKLYICLFSLCSSPACRVKRQNKPVFPENRPACRKRHARKRGEEKAAEQTPHRSPLTASEGHPGMSQPLHTQPRPRVGLVSVCKDTGRAKSLLLQHIWGYRANMRCRQGQLTAPHVLPLHPPAAASRCADDARGKDHRGPIYMQPCFSCWVFQTWLLLGFFLTCLSK